MAVEIGGDVLAGAGEEGDQAIVEDEFPELSATGDFVNMCEDDVRGAEGAGAGVGVLDELALVGGIDDQHAGGNVEFVEGLLQVAHGFSREDHAGDVEVNDGILGHFAEFGAGAQEGHSERFAEHGEFLGGVRLVGLEFHDECPAATEEDIGGKLLAEGGGGAGAGRAEECDAVREGQGAVRCAVAHEEREVGDGGLERLVVEMAGFGALADLGEEFRGEPGF